MTKFLDQLRRAERDINGHFLDFKQRPKGNYTRRELSKFDAYTVLVHAEMESYFEACATRAVDLAEQALRKDAYNRILYSLSAFYATPPEDGESVTKVPEKDIWRQKGGRSIKAHRDTIRQNHGIKLENICRMLIPVGLDVRKIAPVLLIELEQFGSIRGSTAHSSLKVRRGTVVDPFIKAGEVQKLVALLAVFDGDFHEFIQGQKYYGGRPPVAHDPIS